MKVNSAFMKKKNIFSCNMKFDFLYLHYSYLKVNTVPYIDYYMVIKNVSLLNNFFISY